MRKKTIGLIQKPISKYKEIIATLPRSNRRNWIVDLYQYEGFWFPLWPLEGLLLAQDYFKLQPNDVILSSLPKSGTTWLGSEFFHCWGWKYIEDRTQDHVREGEKMKMMMESRELMLFFFFFFLFLKRRTNDLVTNL